MQAYRAAATVENDHALYIADVPFRPGSVVEVIVLEPGDLAESTPRDPATRILELAGSWADMPEAEYDAFRDEITERRRRAGAERRQREIGTD